MVGCWNAMDYPFPYCVEKTNIKKTPGATHPCIFKVVYAREVKDTSQAGEGESGPALKATSL